MQEAVTRHTRKMQELLQGSQEYRLSCHIACCCVPAQPCAVSPRQWASFKKCSNTCSRAWRHREDGYNEQFQQTATSEAELQPKPEKGKGKGKTGKGKGKQRSNGWTSSWKTQNAEMDSTVYALARLCLKQEEELAEIRQEKMFMLHMTTSVDGVEQSQRPGEGRSQPADMFVSTHDTGTDCPPEKVQGVSGEYQCGPQGRLDFWRPSHVAISTLVPSQGMSHQGRDKQRHHSRGACQHAGGHGCSAPERPDCSLQFGNRRLPFVTDSLGSTAAQPFNSSGPIFTEQRTSAGLTRSQHGPGLRVRQEQLRTRLNNPPSDNAFATLTLPYLH